MLQEIIVYLIVAGAAFYLGRMVWSTFTSKKSCRSCGDGGCATKKSNATQTPQPTQLVQIQINKKS